jgi:transcriptional regulator with XRE-family HTH domain
MDCLNRDADSDREVSGADVMRSEIPPKMHSSTLTSMDNSVQPPPPEESPIWCCQESVQSGNPKPQMNRLRTIRLARGLSLEEAAKRVGTSLQQLGRLERGERKLTEDWMRRIAPALGVRPADLISDEGVDLGEFIQSPEEIKLLRFWRMLAPIEKRWIVAVALDHGLDLLSSNGHQPGKRRA